MTEQQPQEQPWEWNAIQGGLARRYGDGWVRLDAQYVNALEARIAALTSKLGTAEVERDDAIRSVRELLEKLGEERHRIAALTQERDSIQHAEIAVAQAEFNAMREERDELRSSLLAVPTWESVGGENLREQLTTLARERDEALREVWQLKQGWGVEFADAADVLIKERDSAEAATNFKNTVLET